MVMMESPFIKNGLIFIFCPSPGAVEACLLHGLRKRALGLFKFSNTTALLQKVSKSFESAAEVVKLVSEIEANNDPNK